MPIKGTEYMKGRGKKVPTNAQNVHVTQTNEDSRDGKGAHITTNIPGTQAKVHDYYNAEGNYKKTKFGKR